MTLEDYIRLAIRPWACCLLTEHWGEVGSGKNDASCRSIPIAYMEVRQVGRVPCTLISSRVKVGERCT